MTDRMRKYGLPIKEPWVGGVFTWMSLTKIPFILLGTWGIHTNYTSPNPPPPQHERIPSSLAVPFENSGFLPWVPITLKVSNYSEDTLAEKLTKRASDTRSHNMLLALLRYQLSWHLRTEIGRAHV